MPMNPDWCGDSEVIVGKWLKDRGCRDEFIIATKVPHHSFCFQKASRHRFQCCQHLSTTRSRAWLLCVLPPEKTRGCWRGAVMGELAGCLRCAS